MGNEEGDVRKMHKHTEVNGRCTVETLVIDTMTEERDSWRKVDKRSVDMNNKSVLYPKLYKFCLNI